MFATEFLPFLALWRSWTVEDQQKFVPELWRFFVDNDERHFKYMWNAVEWKDMIHELVTSSKSPRLTEEVAWAVVLAKIKTLFDYDNNSIFTARLDREFTMA